MSDRELPIFELPLVLLPGEQVPLHIFEEQYKRMIGRSIDQHEPFGVVLRDEDGARSVGCTAEVSEEIEQLDDGRMNVVVSGVAPFRVLDRWEGSDFPAGEVELIEDMDLPPSDETVAESAREAFAELAELATGNRPEPDGLRDAGAYAIAARVELPPETKQALLETRDEDERMRMLANALRALEKAVERAEVIADRARSNGRVSFSDS